MFHLTERKKKEREKTKENIGINKYTFVMLAI
jgi:hypothetical protein